MSRFITPSVSAMRRIAMLMLMAIITLVVIIAPSHVDGQTFPTTQTCAGFPPCQNGGYYQAGSCQCRCSDAHQCLHGGTKKTDCLCQCSGSWGGLSCEVCSTVACPTGFIQNLQLCTCTLPQGAQYVQLHMKSNLALIQQPDLLKQGLLRELAEQLGLQGTPWRLNFADDFVWKVDHYQIDLGILPDQAGGQPPQFLIRALYQNANSLRFKGGSFTSNIDTIWSQCSQDPTTGVRTYSLDCDGGGGTDTGKLVLIWLTIIVACLCVVTFFSIWCCGNVHESCWKCQDSMDDFCEEYCWWCFGVCRRDAEGTQRTRATKKIAKRPGGGTWSKLSQLEERGVRV